jgi:hypothetical protein
MDTRASDTASGARLAGPLLGRPAPHTGVCGDNQFRSRPCDFKSAAKPLRGPYTEPIFGARAIQGRTAMGHPERRYGEV